MLALQSHLGAKAAGLLLSRVGSQRLRFPAVRNFQEELAVLKCCLEILITFKPGMVVRGYTFTSWEVEAGKSGVQGQCQLHREFKLAWDT